VLQQWRLGDDRVRAATAAKLYAGGDEVKYQYREIAHLEIVAIILDQARRQKP